MLVLSRLVGQELHIGGNIVITIIDVKGKLVKVGIDAPREIQITRPDSKKGFAKPAEGGDADLRD